MKRLLAAALATVVVVAVPACSGSEKADKVTLLAHSSFTPSEEVLADFTAQTGYKVEVLTPGDAGVVVNEAILRKDNPVADALFGVDNTFLTRALDAGIFEPYEAKGLDTLRKGVYVDPEHRATTIDEADVCLNYDKTWFGHDGRPPAPTSLASLTDPRYKNRTVVENAATSSPGFAFLLATISAYGEGNGADARGGWKGYWAQLRANGVRVVDDWTAAYLTDFTAGGGGGDRPIVVSYGSSPPADVVGAVGERATPRVGVIVSSCFHQFELAGVLHNANNPAGARALVDFFLSRRFQEDMPLQMYVNPVVSGASVPDVYKQWAVIPAKPASIDPVEIGRQRDTWIKEWTDIVVR